MLPGVGEECSLLPWLGAAGFHHLHLLSPVSPRVLCSSLRHHSEMEEALNAARVYLLVSSFSCMDFSRVWKLSSGWGPWHRRSGLAQWCSGEPWARESLTLSSFTGALQGHSWAHLAHVDTTSPPASLGAGGFDLFQGGTSLTAGERCLTALWPVALLEENGMSECSCSEDEVSSSYWHQDVWIFLLNSR